MTETFTLFVDPGHAWVKVPVAILQELKIADRITRFSYLRNDVAYLEEDCDLATFVRAYREKHGKTPHFIERSTSRNSRIRSYSSYRS
jgi:hypothetical protein